ncbi:glycosyltransferase [Dyadobacter jiangsuensis]|uniref:Glycosyltransferase involved in cell wall biosynthesis n=1 Tax=Dyadobacter jiangsuensis TaxID=1591085 RepID=A0A2P8GJ84_9BACT|nr:glycosyltransferase [Dyadobacter jiangsuensis]PSL34022.1 glycosyltransferase involved in cell wall biosynthesis [Dyadobacter jiangsuensis]
MNILVFNQSFFPLSETFVHRQVVGLSRYHDVTMLTYRYENEDKFPVNAKKLTLAPYEGLPDKLITKVLRVLAGKEAHRLSFQNRSRVSDLLQKGRIDVIHAHFGPSGIEMLPVAKKLGIPMVVSFHGIDAAPAMLNNREYADSIREVIEYAKAVIIVSPHFIDTLNLSRFSSKVHLIPYGADEQKFTPAETPQREQIVIQHVGRLVAKKGVPDLITAFSTLCGRYDNLELRIIGDGPEMPLCKDLVERLNLGEKVSLLGSKPHGVVNEHMKDADIYVLNSRTDHKGDMEGLPNSILEAMSMEKPVVSTYHAGIPQAIQDGVNGLLVGEKDNEGLAVALEMLIRDRDLRRRLGVAARQTIVAHFSANGMETKIQSVFAGL